MKSSSSLCKYYKFLVNTVYFCELFIFVKLYIVLYLNFNCKKMRLCVKHNKLKKTLFLYSWKTIKCRKNTYKYLYINICLNHKQQNKKNTKKTCGTKCSYLYKCFTFDV